MADSVEKGFGDQEDRRRVLRERGYDVDAMRFRVVECGRPVTGEVLDVGTGPGRLAILLAKEGGTEVATVEFEGEGIEVARRNELSLIPFPTRELFEEQLGRCVCPHNRDRC